MAEFLGDLQEVPNMSDKPGSMMLQMTASTKTASPHSAGNSDASLDHLYSAIIQCFVIILFGYIAGRAGIISSSQSSGIGSFVSKFCLPALLFKSMCELKFGQVNWMFLLGILISKASIFALVVLVTLLVRRPVNLGYAGIFGIFATQSNDLALGYPIVQALYGNSHPEYLKYIYLAAPISLMLLNPIGFTLMEVHHYRTVRDEQSHSKVSTAIIHVVKGVMMNPIVFMTTIGVAGNFVLDGKVPGILDDILVVLGQAFSASALFYLGLSMVGKIKSQIGIALVVPVLLITAKTLILPLITWEVVGWLESTENNTQAFSMYGFLYGTFPTAPAVFIFASQYSVVPDVIGTGLVLGTFLSAPLMFVSAKMMTVMVESRTEYKDILIRTSFDICIVSIVCCVWVLGIFILSGKFKRVPHRFTSSLILAHILACASMIAFDSLKHLEGWHHYPVIICLLVGVFSTRCWTAVIAVILCLLHVRSLCFVLRLQVWFYFAGFGLPVLLTGILFLVGNHNIVDEIDPAFHYGTLQATFSIVVLFVSLVVSITSIVWWQRTERHNARSRYNSISSTIEAPVPGSLRVNNTRSLPTPSDGDQGSEEVLSTIRQSSGVEGERSQSSRRNYLSFGANKRASSIEDLVPFTPPAAASNSDEGSDSSGNPLMENLSERTCLIGRCNTEQRHACMDRLRTYTATVIFNGDSPQEEDIRTMREMEREEYQTAHHLIMLLLLLLSLFIGLFLCTWRLFHSTPSGIYIEIEFLDSVFNYGQGFLILTVFGFDTRLVFSPIIRRLRRLFFGAEMVRLPKLTELDPTTKQTCQQFTDYHKDNCAKEIEQDKRFRFRTFKKVFTGSDLCDWLVKAGLAYERDEAVSYGRKLILGRVITHVNSEQDFHDAPYFYKFLDTFEYMTC